MEQVSLLVAFGAGLLSFLTPCVLPLVPVYLASVCGPEILEPEADKKRLPLFFHSLSFVAGFTLVFTILGASVGLLGFAIGATLALTQTIAGGLLIAFGVFLLASLKIPWLNYEKRLAPSTGATTGYLRSLIIGAIFSLAWTPCVGPILGGILTLAWSSETAWQGAALLAVYSLGLGLPFLIIGATFDSLRPFLRRIYRYSTWSYIISGLLLIAVGILILTGKLIWLQGGI
ncbi:MAG: sulfite exporter TauE/SafE family protein [Deltaproteobacteria bacterium]|nr:sulfite exporter TauE/SafE family protein [Deltaproteobacteria bacterium]